MLNKTRPLSSTGHAITLAVKYKSKGHVAIQTDEENSDPLMQSE
jgi:hypothetical protein